MQRIRDAIDSAVRVRIDRGRMEGLLVRVEHEAGVVGAGQIDARHQRAVASDHDEACAVVQRDEETTLAIDADAIGLETSPAMSRELRDVDDHGAVAERSIDGDGVAEDVVGLRFADEQRKSVGRDGDAVGEVDARATVRKQPTLMRW